MAIVPLSSLVSRLKTSQRRGCFEKLHLQALFGFRNDNSSRNRFKLRLGLPTTSMYAAHCE
ncbi:hypothetical protein CPC08DRAFT_717240 [Agrocybe pediades]|nr:hypothetical protein CPC08DRAFT_717240 [Agrocybe pediades]